MNEPQLKKNVSEFNSDVEKNGGYMYTTNSKYSSIVAYRRQTQAISDGIRYFLNEQPKPHSIIDIGCGDGTDASILQPTFPELSYSAFDPAESAIRTAQSRNLAVNFFVANLLDEKTLPSNCFDIGYLHGVLHHTADPKIVIKNCSKFAKRLIILEPNGWNPILKIIEKTSQYHRDHEEQSFSPTLVQSWCESAGYKIIAKKFIGFIPFFFPTIPAKIINAVEPLLEKVPGLKHIFAGTCVLICEKI